MEFVGRIWLENADGAVMATATYDVPEALREPRVLTPIGAFLQSRRNGKTWAYRYDGPLGNREPDPYVREFRSPGDPAWDGPEPSVTPPGYREVLAAFAKAMGEEISPARLLELYQLVQVAWPADRR